MRFSHSLKLNHIFRRLYRSGKNAANRYLVLYCRGNGSKGNRIGITVNAKLAHAVHRNRVRRQLREIYRLHEQEFQPGPRPCRGGALARDRRAVWEAGGGISRAGPRSSVCCGRMYEACNAGPHPLLSAADLAVVPAAVPFFSDLLAVRPRGDLTLWRDGGADGWRSNG